MRRRGERPGGEDAPQRGAGQRSLRVAEALRHTLSRLLREGELRDPALQDASITVTEVRMSPDLRNATVYVMPLGGANAEAIAAGLQRSALFLRRLVGREIALKHPPNLAFALDSSFDRAQRIAALLALPEVERDLEPPAAPQQEGHDGG